MWLFAFNSDHLQLVHSAIQEWYMNLTYESLRYPQDNMRFIFIDAILNNFPYELESYITSLTEEMETSSGDFQTITYNKHLANFEKKEIAINDFKYVIIVKKLKIK